MAATVADRLARALARRDRLAADPSTTAYRLVNGAGDELPGLTVDRYGPLLTVNFYEGEASEPLLQDLVEALAAQTSGAIYLRRRPRQASRLSPAELAARAPVLPLHGQGGPTAVVLEHGLRYLVRMDEGLSSGIFLDMRTLRREIRGWSAGRTVLNTFAYTCAFGVAAMTGGASRVLNLDAARPALDWGRENYRLNDLQAQDYDFVYGDVFDWLGRFARRGQQFELVILDPPSYSTTRTTRWVLERQYDDLARMGVLVTAPGGLLLACANHHGISRQRLLTLTLEGVRQAGRHGDLVGSYSAPEEDFPRPQGTEGALKVLAFKLR